MSAVSPGLIRCDGRSCQRYYPGTGKNAKSIYGTRNQAKKDGWRQKVAEDYCPTHHDGENQ